MLPLRSALYDFWIPLTVAAMRLRETLRRTGLVLASVIALVWPALYNGQPFFYPDTTAYIRGADAAFSKVAGRTTAWSGEGVADTRADSAAAGAGWRSLSSVRDQAVLAGRSIYYGGLLYVGHVLGALWPTVLLQACAVLLALGLTLLSFDIFTWRRLAAIAVLVAALTPASFFISLLMPDIFAAVAILAVANLLLRGRGMRLWMIVAWAVLAASALLFHTSHVLLAAVLLVGIGLARATRYDVTRRGVAAVIVALVVALVGEAAFTAGVTRLVGAPPIRPPFLMARMIADGPGERYLRATCPESGFAVCEFIDRLPITDPDAFLWNSDPDAGVFASAEPATRRRLADEQLRFAIATLAFEPVQQLAAAARNTWTQLSRFGLREFSYSDGARSFLAARVPESYLRTMRTTKAWDGATPTRALAIITGVATLVSLAVLVRRTWRHRSPSPYESRVRVFAVTIVAGILLNAAICGALSTPHDRYQARVIWLLPVVAALMHPRFNPRLHEHAPPIRDAVRGRDP